MYSRPHTSVSGIPFFIDPSMKLLMNLFDSLRESKEVSCCRTGPYTIGGRMTESVNLGDSFAQNSHAAFSAKVLLATANISDD